MIPTGAMAATKARGQTAPSKARGLQMDKWHGTSGVARGDRLDLHPGSSWGLRGLCPALPDVGPILPEQLQVPWSGGTALGCVCPS